MEKHLSINKVLLAVLSGAVLFLLAAFLAAPVHAATVDITAGNVKAPVQLAWYYGHGRYYYGPYRGWYRGGWYHRGYYHSRCWRGAWGYWHCR